MKKELYNDGQFIIEINTNDNKYYLYETEGNQKFQLGDYKTYQQAEQAITRRTTEKKKKIAPIECLYNETASHIERYEPAKITSIKTDIYRTYARITCRDKKRGEIDVTFLLKNTQKNIDINAEIKTLKERISRLNREREKFTPIELKKHFEV